MTFLGVCKLKCCITITFLYVLYSYSALRKYSAPLTFCQISGFKHKDTKLYFFVKNQQQVGHNHEVEMTFIGYFKLF